MSTRREPVEIANAASSPVDVIERSLDRAVRLLGEAAEIANGASGRVAVIERSLARVCGPARAGGRPR
jgi:hypothetical protein